MQDREQLYLGIASVITGRSANAQPIQSVLELSLVFVARSTVDVNFPESLRQPKVPGMYASLASSHEGSRHPQALLPRSFGFDIAMSLQRCFNANAVSLSIIYRRVVSSDANMAVGKMTAKILNHRRTLVKAFYSIEILGLVARRVDSHVYLHFAEDDAEEGDDEDEMRIKTCAVGVAGIVHLHFLKSKSMQDNLSPEVQTIESQFLVIVARRTLPVMFSPTREKK